jgi:glycine cleavage system H lipoate-binding protein
MVDANKDDIFSILKKSTDHKEDTDRALVRIESRLEDRIIEVKTDLKGDILQVKTDLEKNNQQVKTDLEKDIREVKTDLKDDIKEIRNTLRTMTNLIITCGIGILAVIVTFNSEHNFEIIETGD